MGDSPAGQRRVCLRLEDVLDVYTRPYDPARPGHPERVDYEYERQGTSKNRVMNSVKQAKQGT